MRIATAAIRQNFIVLLSQRMKGHMWLLPNRSGASMAMDTEVKSRLGATAMVKQKEA
jgi:hypothetical protein